MASYSNSRDYDAAKARRNAIHGRDAQGNLLGGVTESQIQGQRDAADADRKAKADAKDAARSAAYLAARAAGMSMDDASEIDAVYDSNGDCSAHEAEKYGY